MNIQHRTPNIETKGVVQLGVCKCRFDWVLNRHYYSKDICEFALRADLVSSRRCKS